MNHYGHYQKTLSEKINISRPETLVVMLYEGMITKIAQARERIELGQTVKSKECIIRAMKIADALMEHLNLEEGGEVAQQLEKLYYFIISELAQANRDLEPLIHLDNARKVIDTLLAGWKSLEKRASA